jgi:hypothetical protein
MNIIRVSLRELIGLQLTNRQNVVRAMPANVPSPSSVVLDLLDVNFIARSAAHQLLMEIEKLESASEDIRVSIENASPEVQYMLDVVSRTRFASAPPTVQLEVTYLLTQADTEKALLAL